HSAEPSGINMKHVHAEFGGIANHPFGNLFVDVHASAPTVVDHERIVGILPGFRIAQDSAYPGTKHVAGSIGSASKSPEEHNRRLEGFTRSKPSAEWAWIGVQTQSRLQRVFFPAESKSCPTTEFNSGIPTGE